MKIVHLMASPFFGGPERQMLGLARHLPSECESVFLSFAEKGHAQPFIEEVHKHGIPGRLLRENFPHVRRAVAELVRELRAEKADLLTCSGYKPDIIGWLAARQAGIPAVSISHGWTAATMKVRLNELIDRFVLRFMDAVVCVSEAQAVRVRQALVPESKIVVIHNAVAPEAFAPPDPEYGERLRALLGEDHPRHIVGGAGRLSPEKGFDLLVEAAALVLKQKSNVGFVHFGDGPERDKIRLRIRELGLERRFVLAGFRADLGKFLPHLDLIVLPSYTEGLPVVLLEAFAAGVPAVATAVGGTPEVIEEGKSGLLVPPGDCAALGNGILDALADDARRRDMGKEARMRARDHFGFAALARRYFELFERLCRK